MKRRVCPACRQETVQVLDDLWTCIGAGCRGFRSQLSEEWWELEMTIALLQRTIQKAVIVTERLAGKSFVEVVMDREAVESGEENVTC